MTEAKYKESLASIRVSNSFTPDEAVALDWLLSGAIAAVQKSGDAVAQSHSRALASIARKASSMRRRAEHRVNRRSFSLREHPEEAAAAE